MENWGRTQREGAIRKVGGGKISSGSVWLICLLPLFQAFPAPLIHRLMPCASHTDAAVSNPSTHAHPGPVMSRFGRLVWSLFFLGAAPAFLRAGPATVPCASSGFSCCWPRGNVCFVGTFALVLRDLPMLLRSVATQTTESTLEERQYCQKCIPLAEVP